MILFIGQVGSEVVEREAFQEIDYRRMFGQMAKWVAQIDRADRVPEYVSHAFHTRGVGRPGPVVLALPEDMLTDTATVADTGPLPARRRASRRRTTCSKLREMLAQAQRPFVILGGGGWNAAGVRRHPRLRRGQRPAGRLRVPLPGPLRQPRSATTPATSASASIPSSPSACKDCDLLLAVGARLGEMTTGGYTLIDMPRPKQKPCTCIAGAEELGRVYQARSADQLRHAGIRRGGARRWSRSNASAWHEWTRAARADYEAWLSPVQVPGAVDLGEVIAFLRKRLPPDTIVTNGAGNFSLWVHRFYRYTGFRTQLAPTSGAMGYGVPAGVAAKLVHPERTVVSFCGRRRLPDDRAGARDRGAVRREDHLHRRQQRHVRHDPHAPGARVPGRVSGTMLKNPDFAALARAYGLHGEIVEKTADFEPRVRARAGGTAPR